MGCDTLASLQVRDRTSHFQDPVIRPCGKTEPVHCHFHKMQASFIYFTIFPYVPGLHLGVGINAVRPEALLLYSPGVCNTLADRRRGFCNRIGSDLVELDGRNFDMNVDTVHERAGNAGAVGLDLVRCAQALVKGIAVKPAFAGVQ